MNTAHNFSGVLHAKGMFTYCNKCLTSLARQVSCGLIRLGNRATEKAINKPCAGARDLDDNEYLKIKGVKYGKS